MENNSEDNSELIKKKNKDDQANKSEISEKRPQWPLFLPYYVCNMYTPQFDDRDLLMSTNIPTIYLHPLDIKADHAEIRKKICQSIANNNSITSIVAINNVDGAQLLEPADFIRFAPNSLKEFSLQCLCPPKMQLSNLEDFFNAILQKKSLERISLTDLGGFSGPHPLPTQISNLIKRATHINGYALESYCCNLSVLESLKSATHVTNLSLRYIDFDRQNSTIFQEFIGRLKKLSITECKFLNDQTLADLLANGRSSLTSLSLSKVFDSATHIGTMLMAFTNLKELSLSSIEFKSFMDQIPDLLKNNKTLTKLSLEQCNINEECCSIIMGALEKNTTLTHLSFTMEKFKGDSIGKYLQSNCSLKTLELKKCLELDLEEISLALEVNSTLTSLHIQRSSTELPHHISYEHVYNNHFGTRGGGIVPFINALKVNKTIKVLSIDFEGELSQVEDLLVALQNNLNLEQLLCYPTKATLPRFRENWPYIAASTMNSRVIELLRINRRLKMIDVCIMYRENGTAQRFRQVDVGSQVFEKIHENRRLRQEAITGTIVIMKMAVLRPEFLGTHLPLEVWQIIFSFCLDYFDVDTSKIFSSIVASYSNNNKQHM